jgi:hypothetical protein
MDGFRIFALTLAVLLLCVARPAAHDVPSDVTIRAYLKPEGATLRLLVRVPLASMNDIPWPTAGLLLNLGDPEMPLALRDGARDWIADRITILENDELLTTRRLAAVRISLPSDTSFGMYGSALRHVLGAPLSPETELPRSQAMVDALIEYPIHSDRSRFSIDPRYRLLGLRALTILRFLAPDGAERALQFHDDPGLVRLDPRWFQAAWLFTVEGFYHILGGIDHLLFLFCLVIPFRRFRQLIVVVTAFTVAHSITLIASAYNLGPDAGWFPPLVETLIATSIVYMALENIIAPGLGRRWLIAFGFGLIHGFGFSFALRDTMQLAGSHLLLSLVSFNLGVEIGQVAVLAVLIPALTVAFRLVLPERTGTIVLSAIVAHTGWHWMIERGQQLARYQFEWPDLTPAFFAGVLRWLMIIVGVCATAWLLRVVVSWRKSLARGL